MAIFAARYLRQTYIMISYAKELCCRRFAAYFIWTFSLYAITHNSLNAITHNALNRITHNALNRITHNSLDAITPYDRCVSS